MKFAHEILRNVFGQIQMRKSVSGHAQAIERIGRVHALAERFEDAHKRSTPGRKRHPLEIHGSQCAVIEDDPFAAGDDIIHVGAPARHTIQEALKERHRERLRDHRARYACRCVVIGYVATTGLIEPKRPS